MSDGLITLIVALVAAAPGVYAIFSGRQKARAEAASIVANAAAALVKPLEKRIDALETEVQQLRADNRLLRRQNHEMAQSLRALWVFATEYVENYGDAIPPDIANPVIDALEGADG